MGLQDIKIAGRPIYFLTGMLATAMAFLTTLYVYMSVGALRAAEIIYEFQGSQHDIYTVLSIIAVLLSVLTLVLCLKITGKGGGSMMCATFIMLGVVFILYINVVVIDPPWGSWNWSFKSTEYAIVIGFHAIAAVFIMLGSIFSVAFEGKLGGRAAPKIDTSDVPPASVLLRNVEPNKIFYFYRDFGEYSGTSSKNMDELLTAIQRIDLDTFKNHVSDFKNDIAQWVLNAIGDPILAQQIYEVRPSDFDDVEEMKSAMTEIIRARYLELRKESSPPMSMFGGGREI